MTEPCTKERWLVFEQGDFRWEDCPEWWCEDEDWKVVMRRGGFSEVQQLGDQNGIGAALWDNSDDDGDSPRHIFLFSTACRGVPIICHGWPDFFRLLSLLSPIFSAAALYQTRYGKAVLPVLLIKNE